MDGKTASSELDSCGSICDRIDNAFESTAPASAKETYHERVITIDRDVHVCSNEILGCSG